jgi:hypothetical protein
MSLILDGTDGITQPSITTAFGLPAGTTAQRPSPPVAGMLRFNTETALVEAYTGTEWSAGVDVEQAIADFAAGEPGQPRLVGQAVSVFPGTYPVLTVTASDAQSVNNGLGTTVANGPATSSTSFVDSTSHTILKYTGTIRFRVIVDWVGGNNDVGFELRALKNGVQASIFTGTAPVLGAAGPYTAEISVVPTDIVLWQLRRTSGDGPIATENANNTASNGYATAILYAPAV